MPSTGFIYLAAVMIGALMGWGFAVPMQEMLDFPPSDNPVMWMLSLGIVGPIGLRAFLRA